MINNLPATYFGPVWWYSKLLRQTGLSFPVTREGVEECIDKAEAFQKQTIRNRCVIMTSQGLQKLSIPVVGSSSHHQLMADTLISDHGNWRHQHWQSMQTAYGNAPFFEYYQDYLRPFFLDETVIADSLAAPIVPPCRLTHLLDFNIATTSLVLSLLDIKKGTEAFLPSVPSVYCDPSSDLSILDLLFHKGPQSVLYL